MAAGETSGAQRPRCSEPNTSTGTEACTQISPYRVAGANHVPWLFADTGLKDGSLIPGYYGIEIDATTSSSPPGTIVVATIPNIFPAETADMTYYTTAAGAEVFDAGTINFSGAAKNLYVAGC